MQWRWLVPMLAVAVLAACSTSPYRDKPSARLTRVEAAAGKDVDSFTLYSGLYSWESLSDTKVLLYTRPRRAYLLDVAPCPNLDTAVMLGVSSRFSTISAGIDSVIPDYQSPPGYPCRIQRIRRVDVKALKAAEKAASAKPETPPAKHEAKLVPRPKAASDGG